MSKVKRKGIFYDNVMNGPIQPDGYLGGWMFFETRVIDNIGKIELECHDREQKLHRMEVGASNIFSFVRTLPESTITNRGVGPSLEFEDNPAPQSPEVQEYMRGMYQYAWPKQNEAPQK